jgi:hypothetical protein
MSLPDESGLTDDRQLARYLLGLLPEEETERLDEESIADDEVASRLRIVENELVDAYVAGTLSGEMLERFECHYLASPHRRENVKFARRFLRAIDRTTPRSEPGPLTDSELRAGPRPFEGSGRSSSLVPASAGGRTRPARWQMAAAALFIVAFGTLLFQVERFRNGLDAAQREAVALANRARDLERQLAEQRAANDTATSELALLRNSATAPAARPAQDAPTFALVLLPQTRALGPVPAIAIPPAADRIAFELRLESNDFSRYQVALKDPGSNQIVWRSDFITPTSLDHTPTVSVIVPTRGLKAQHYSLAITGHSGRSGSNSEVVGSYTFQVVHH